MLRLKMAPKFSELTTLRLGDACVAMIHFDAEDAPKLPEVLAHVGGHPMPFGGGSNILAAGGEKEATLLCPVCTKEPAILAKKKDGSVLAEVDAGMKVARLLVWAAKHGFSGLEGMAGVPGKLGGAIAGNAGSFGSDVGSCLRRVSVFSAEHGCLDLEREDFSCSYRHFCIPLLQKKTWYVIVRAVLEFKSADPAAIRAKMQANLVQKITNQPVHACSAGCLFKNPAGKSAGRLLDEAGFRGKRLGGVAFSPIHANFLVNEGNGTVGQALELVQLAKEEIRHRYGLNLQEEVRIWKC